MKNEFFNGFATKSYGKLKQKNPYRNFTNSNRKDLKGN